MGGLGGGEEREIKAWAEGIVGHYERKRRMEVLAKARQVIIDLESGGETFLAEVKVEEGEVEVVPVQEEGGEVVNGKIREDVGGEENGWNFDDEEEGPISATAVAPESSAPPPPVDDPADAWEWDDEGGPVVAEEDDPWAAQIDEPASAPPLLIPKPATRLEKYSVKGKTNGVSPSPSPAATHTTAQMLEKRAPPPSQLTIKQALPKETYLVSGRTQLIIRLVEDVLGEAREFASSTLFPSSTALGTLISQSALLVLDLYRALYPVIFGSHFALSSELAMRFSNDCLYLSEEVSRISIARDIDGILQENLHLCRDNLNILGESWYLDTIVSRHLGNPTFLSVDTDFVRAINGKQTTRSWPPPKVSQIQPNKIAMTYAKMLLCGFCRRSDSLRHSGRFVSMSRTGIPMNRPFFVILGCALQKQILCRTGVACRCCFITRVK